MKAIHFELISLELNSMHEKCMKNIIKFWKKYY